MTLPRFVTAVLAAVLISAAGAVPASAAKRAPKLNELQVIGTHNSYKREISAKEQKLYEDAIGQPGAYGQALAYSHAPIGQQLADQGVRGLELDLLPDPQGGLYATPLVRRLAGAEPLADPRWKQPGIKVLHVPDLDYRSTCVLLVSCLREVKKWSDANRRHLPVFILLELTQSEPQVVKFGGVQSPPWDGVALDQLDREIRSVFPKQRLITPDNVRRKGWTLNRSVRRAGWPTLKKSRGKVLFLMDNSGPIRETYREGHPSLQGRVVFTNATPGDEDAAFVKRNEPRDKAANIPQLVRQGYLVRTRADEPLGTILSGDTTQRAAALRSGAQVISTDFPVAGMAARYDSSFFVGLPGGLMARCNPLIAPRSCKSGTLEAKR